jgi:hypothetical protein
VRLFTIVDINAEDLSTGVSSPTVV